MWIILFWRVRNHLLNAISCLQAQEMDSISLEVSKIVEEEKILIEKCSDLLSVVHALQVRLLLNSLQALR